MNEAAEQAFLSVRETARVAGYILGFVVTGFVVSGLGRVHSLTRRFPTDDAHLAESCLRTTAYGQLPADDCLLFAAYKIS